MSYEILNAGTAELEVEKSRFISMCLYCENPLKVQDFLKKLKKEHQKARHICYAYKINDQIKYSDDGEPSGTAGRPILNLINLYDLNNCLVLVIRYFGGTLLGSGRLLRTYAESAKRAINNAILVELVKENYFKIEIDYDTYDSFNHYLKINHFSIIKINFNDKIKVEFYTPLSFKESIEDLFYGKLKILEFKEVIHRKEKKDV